MNFAQPSFMMRLTAWGAGMAFHDLTGPTEKTRQQLGVGTRAVRNRTLGPNETGTML